MSAIEFLIFSLPVLLIALGYLIGKTRERGHIRSLDRREATLADIAVTDLKTIPDLPRAKTGLLVMGDAVIATDYFKSFALALRTLVGGEIRSLETLMSRARREAIIRMLEDARRAGAREVYNVRIETSNILSQGGRGKTMSAEAFAFGTAVVR